MSFTNDEERAEAVHRLKAWVVAGMAPDVMTKTQHGRLKKKMTLDAIPDIETLEKQMPPEGRVGTDIEEEDLGGSGAKPLARGRGGRGRGAGRPKA
eukprot:4822326-Lingulodinium_polyedra.AAC.1